MWTSGSRNGGSPTLTGRRAGWRRTALSLSAPARQVTLLQRKTSKHGAGLGKTTG